MNVVLFAWCATSVVYLDALYSAGEPPLIVVTGTLAPVESALAERCAKRGIELLRTDDAGAPEITNTLTRLAPDLILVAGWPKRLRQPLLGLARIGIVNAHPSLLPAYRGKDPLFWALVAGEPVVGVTLHRMTETMDAGPILFQRAVPVPAGATSASLAQLVDRAGAELLMELLDVAKMGALPEDRTPVEPGSYFPPVRPEHVRLDWQRSAPELERLMRASIGVERAHFTYHGMKIVVVEGSVLEHEPRSGATSAPGTVLAIMPAGIEVRAGDLDGEPTVLCLQRFVFLERAYDGAALAELVGIHRGAKLD